MSTGPFFLFQGVTPNVQGDGSAWGPFFYQVSDYNRKQNNILDGIHILNLHQNSCI